MNGIGAVLKNIVPDLGVSPEKDVKEAAEKAAAGKKEADGLEALNKQVEGMGGAATEAAKGVVSTGADALARAAENNALKANPSPAADATTKASLNA